MNTTWSRNKRCNEKIESFGCRGRTFSCRYAELHYRKFDSCVWREISWGKRKHHDHSWETRRARSVFETWFGWDLVSKPHGYWKAIFHGEIRDFRYVLPEKTWNEISNLPDLGNSSQASFSLTLCRCRSEFSSIIDWDKTRWEEYRCRTHYNAEFFRLLLQS